MRRRSSNKWCEARRRGWPNSLRSVYTRGGNTAQNAVLKGKRMRKLQAPSTKLQRSTKHQTPITRLSLAGRALVPFGILNLKFLWSLVLGAWCFAASAQSLLNLDFGVGSASRKTGFA